VLGQPLDHPESYLGCAGGLVESPAFYPALTGAELIAVLATIAGHERSQIPLLLEWVGLAARGDDRFRSTNLSETEVG
jgi:ABC-2 type transport system ATP-binding protein